jgi:hypothetical protein
MTPRRWLNRHHGIRVKISWANANDHACDRSDEKDFVRKLLLLGFVLFLPVAGPARLCAQASALPSAQAGPSAEAPDHGRALIDEMIQALGGDAWLNRQDWKVQGRTASFYKGKPHDEVPQFEEYYRTKPFGERVVFITHGGTLTMLGLPGKNFSDIAEVWTPDNGYELTYKGTKPLPKKDVEEYQRHRAHSLETVVTEWLHEPGVELAYEGPDTASRRLTDKVSVLTPGNDVVTLQLDATTHLPLSLTYQWRDPLYHDLNTELEEFDDYHTVQGIATPYTVTRSHNGEMIAQRFVTKVAYNLGLPPDLFDQNHPLTSKGK